MNDRARRRPDEPRALRRRLVVEWQRPIYNLAYRLLGHESDAADATQEVFVHLLERLDRYDPGQELGPWVLRVAANRIRDLMRRQKSQQRRDRHWLERETPEPRSPAEREQKQELDAALRHQIARLADTLRLPLVLHYYSGLTVAEVGEVLDLATSTVHSRIQSGLEKLQQSLSGRGFALPAIVSPALLEQTMRSAVTLPVPAKTAAALAHLAATGASGSSWATVLASAGVIMKSHYVSVAIVGVLSLIVGLGAHDVLFPTSSEVVRAGTSDQSSIPTQASTEEIARLQEELEEMSRTLAALKLDNQRLVAKLEAPVTTESGVGGPDEGALESDVPITTVDWEHLSDLLAANIDLLKIDNHPDADFTDEQQASLDALWKAWSEAGAIARAKNPYAFLDQEYLPGILAVVLGETLDLNDAQIAHITDHALDLLSRNRPSPDTTPLEAHTMRQELIDGIQARLQDTLGGSQRDNYDEMQTWVKRMLVGEQNIRILGLKEPEAVQNRIRRAWRKSYGFERGQLPEVDRYVDGYIGSQRAILERFGQLGDNPRQLSPEENRRMRAAVLELGLATEKQILPHLTPAQREALPNSLPMLIRLQDNNSILVGTTGYPGF